MAFEIGESFIFERKEFANTRNSVTAIHFFEECLRPIVTDNEIRWPSDLLILNSLFNT
jgi:hypothetical protein